MKDFDNNPIDCIITDLMLLIMSGEEFIQEIRKKSNVHIIIISAKIMNEDKIEGLRKGGDDYLFKPFLEDEVIIKLRNLFHKKEQKKRGVSFNNNEIIFEEGKNSITILNRLISLTSVEYKILKLLIQEHNSIITRQQFLDIIYDIGGDVFDRVIDVHIRNIRKKINQEYSKEIIKTIYGLGYSFVGVLDD